MTYVSLYRKYRPHTFSEILGQEHVSVPLANAVTEGRISHAYLFTGPRGTGKTSTARILAMAINCEKGPTSDPCGKCNSCASIINGSSLDVIEMDAASHSKVDETREILAGVPLATAGGRKKIYVIDEVHMLSAQAFNALLKTLEEPPSHVVFVLATTEAHKVLPTIVSRTQRFDFRPLPVDVLETHLAQVAKAENIDIDPGALSVIARRAEGGARDALSALDQLASFGQHVTEEDADRLLGRRWDEAFVEWFDAIASRDLGAVIWTVHSLVAQGADPRQLTERALEHARKLLLLSTAPDADVLLDVAEDDRAALDVQARRFSAGDLVRVLDLLSSALVEMRNSPNHRLLLEIAVIRAAAPDTDPSARGALGRIERLERRLGIAGETIEATESTREAPVASAPAPTARPVPAPRPKRQSAPQTPATAKPVAQPEEATVPAAATPSSAATTAEPRVPVTIGLGHIKDSWKATIGEVNQRSKKVAAYLNPSMPVDFGGEVLTIEVQSKFHVDAMSDPKNKEILAHSLHAALGIRPSLAFIERSAVRVTPQSDSSEVADAESVVAADVDVDPLELVKKGLSAEVVEEIERS